MNALKHSFKNIFHPSLGLKNDEIFDFFNFNTFSTNGQNYRVLFLSDVAEKTEFFI